MKSALFASFDLKQAQLRNRIAVPPMCQYGAEDGFTTGWHPAHYAGLARGGAGLVQSRASSLRMLVGRQAPIVHGKEMIIFRMAILVAGRQFLPRQWPMGRIFPKCRGR